MFCRHSQREHNAALTKESNEKGDGPTCGDRSARALPAVTIPRPCPRWSPMLTETVGVACRLARRTPCHRPGVGGNRQPHLLTFPLQPLELLRFRFLCALCEPHLAIPSEFEDSAASAAARQGEKAGRYERERGCLRFASARSRDIRPPQCQHDRLSAVACLLK